MSLDVTIDTSSPADAELIASLLPGRPRADSWRGYGVIRLRCRTRDEMKGLLDAVGESARQNGFRWVRVRFGDDERVYRY